MNNSKVNIVYHQPASPTGIMVLTDFTIITICTQNRTHYLGEIISGQNANNEVVAFLEPTEIGKVAIKNWESIPEHFPFVEIDDFVVMPNHIHSVIFINKPDKASWQINKFGVQSQNLASVIRGYKASVKAWATINKIDFAWQPRYYDHVIRTEKEYSNISGYIADNPQQWLFNGDDKKDFYL